MPHFDDSEDDIDDPEAPDPSEMDADEDSVDTVECPSCGRTVYEHATVCPGCGADNDSSKTGLSGRVVAILIIVIIASVAIAVFG